MIRKIKALFAGYRIKRLKNKCLKAWQKTGMQFFIVKLNGKITILSKADFTLCRSKGIFPKSFTADNLKEIALYYTPTSINK